jgi:hypothetical protein
MRFAASVSFRPTITIRVSGKLLHSHLSYLNQLVSSAEDCELWALLDLAKLVELDRAALLYLLRGDGRQFGIVACPNFIREWMDHEKRQVMGVGIKAVSSIR